MKIKGTSSLPHIQLTPRQRPRKIYNKQQENLVAILAQCPVCKTRQSVKKKICGKCDHDLDQAKKSKRLIYWISYRLPSGKQKQEAVSTSIDEARAAMGKRKAQKKEGKLFDVKDDAKMTFSELAEWYMGLEKVKSKSYYPTVKYNLKSFNDVFGNLIINRITLDDLENYQIRRQKEGYSDSYIDQQIGAAKAMVNRGFKRDKISGRVIREFQKIERLLKKDSNARDRILTHDEFNRLCEHSARHILEIVISGYYTGMRRGEILNLTWDKVDMKNRFINLDAEDTKDKEKRSIPICDELYEMLTNVTRHINDPHVFLFRGKPVSDIRSGLVNACEKADIVYGRKEKDGFTFHDLRHTFNTNMRKAGVTESVIMAITGHSTREMFDRYNTVDQEDTRNAVKTLEVFFQNVTQNVNNAENE